MPIPSAITDLSATIGSNSPSGADTPIDGDNFLRAHAAFIRQMYDGLTASGYATLAGLADTTNVAKGDAFVGVKRTETGAVGATLHTWVQRHAVTPEDFGAVGDGSTDDTTAWQTAIDRAATLGGVVLATPGKVYRITASLTLATKVDINLRNAAITQATTNVPVFTAPSATTIQHWAIRNGTLAFSTQQTAANTLGVGVQLALGAVTYDWVIEDVTVDSACDGILCGTSANTFTFAGRVDNFIAVRCAAWGINISCDTSAGSNTNLVFTNCWSVQIAGAEIAGSKGFRFNACSMSQWRSLYADHIQSEFLNFTSCSGALGVLSAESCDWTQAAGSLSLITFSDSHGVIESLLFTANNVTVTGAGEIYFLRPISSGAAFAVTVEHWTATSNAYSGANIYEVNPTSGTATYNKLAKLDRTANLADFGVTKLIRLWNGVDRSIGRGTTAQRPTPAADAIGAQYMDNTLDADGKPIWWNGTAWVDATGAVV